MTRLRTREQAREGVPNFQARLDALRPHMNNGPGYNRRVVDEVADAFHAWETSFVGARLVTAEIAAGLRALNPTTRSVSMRPFGA